MERKEPNQNPLNSGENPSTVLYNIAITTLFTLAVGGVIIYFGLI